MSRSRRLPTRTSSSRAGRRRSRLAKTVNVIHIAKGKKIVTINMKDAPDADTLAGLMLGPTGNLRAPTIRKGKTLYVGFNEEGYRKML